jgi:hypothetical protein
MADLRNPLLVTHSVADILRAHVPAVACGYEDADDLDHQRTDPGFKLACGRQRDTGNDQCSQPTMARRENAPTLRMVVQTTCRCDRHRLREPQAAADRRHLRLTVT